MGISQEEIFENMLLLMRFGVYFERILKQNGYFHKEIIIVYLCYGLGSIFYARKF